MRNVAISNSPAKKKTMEEELTSEQYKQKGNEEFKKGNHIKAIEFYSKAIGNFQIINLFPIYLKLFPELAPKEASLYANRAACFLQLKK